MERPAELTDAELAAVDDPAALLQRVRALEPELRLAERSAALERLEQLLDSGRAPPAPDGRDWRLEGLAERAIDASNFVRLDEATRLADAVLRDADPSARLAVLRALMARARTLAWTGTDQATRDADAVYLEAIERARALGETEWLGTVLFWRANTVFFENGHRTRAAELMEQALAMLGEESPRRATVLSFYADVLVDLGEWDRVDALLDEADAIADRDRDVKTHAYVAWTRARLMSLRGDALATERLIEEVGRGGGDWLAMDTGHTFRAEAAEMLDRVGLTEQAQRYLERALAPSPTHDIAQQARATMLARAGDPVQALAALQELARGEWLEKRMVWRHTLLTAWATFRAGRGDAGVIAGRALEQAIAGGGLRVALAGEPEITRALAPLAQDAGSPAARELLLDGRPLLVRLFGTPAVLRADGSSVALPAGKPGELVRMLALHEHGLPVEVVVERFFPDVAPTAGRHRLRQVLLRLRTVAPDVVVRDGDQLRLAPAWVDVREFLAVADRARATVATRAIVLSYAALALRRGPLLPSDPYAEWASDTREHVEYRHLTILDQIAAAAAARGSHEEALAALDTVLREGAAEQRHLTRVREHLRALGRHSTAEYVEERAAGGDLRQIPGGDGRS